MTELGDPIGLRFLRNALNIDQHKQLSTCQTP